MEKDQVLKIIDDVMNNREIDSIRNAILAIRDKVIELPDDDSDWTKEYTSRLKLRGNNELCICEPWFDGAEYVCIDTCAKIDSGVYGTMWYE